MRAVARLGVVRRFAPHALITGITLLASLTAGAAAGLRLASPEQALLAVRINGVDTGEVVPVALLGPDAVAVPADQLQQWRLRAPTAPTAPGSAWVALSDIPGLQQHIDNASQTLELQVPGAAFAHSVLRAPGMAGETSLSTATGQGGFFNYDLQAQHSQGLASQGRSLGGLLEAGYFNPSGTGAATALWNSANPASPRWVRLDTQWTVDRPALQQSLRWGDSISQPGSWARSVRFGGFQWATNFATQPSAIPFVLPSVRGEAVLPSTLDLYVNNVRQFQTQVPAGPFDLPGVPALTGQGQVQLVLRDALGRQQTLVQPYFVSPRLLQPGVRDFSWDIGAIREDYGLASGRYGRGVVAYTERLGISPTFTREWRLALLRSQRTASLGGVWRVPETLAAASTVSLNAAASQSPQGSGQQLSAASEHWLGQASVTLRWQQASRDFAELGRLEGNTPRQSASVALNLPVLGNPLGLSLLRQTTWEGSDTRLLSANYAIRVGQGGQLGAYLLKDLSGKTGLTVGAVLSQALDAGTHLSAEVARQGGRTNTTLQALGNPPAGDGVGYRLLVGQGDLDRQLAGGQWQTPRGLLTGEVARFGTDTAYRVGFSGGVAMAGGQWFVTRRIDDSFAVVQVGQLEGVRVYRDNQEVARTGPHGMTLVTRLRAYQDNPIGIEPADLPLDAEVGHLTLRLSPRLRSGVVASFAVRSGRAVELRVVDEAGQPLAAGSVLRLASQDRVFLVGHGGRSFLSGLADTDRLTGQRADGRPCQTVLSLPASPDPVPDLGTLVCRSSP